jgi:hypothetical protein
MSLLKQYIHQLEWYLDQSEKMNTKISQVSVGRHIDHSLIALKEIMIQVIHSDSNNYKRSFNIWRIFVLWIWIIPRGRAKAPDFTLPKKILNKKDIRTHLDEVNQLLPIFEALIDNRKHCNHPFFGMLTLKQSKRNCLVHTKHHLNIIRDIISK